MITSNAAADNILGRKFFSLKLVKMATKRRIEQDERVAIKILQEEGYSTTEIAAKVKCSQSAVSKTLSRLRETGSLKDRKRSGRPKISNPRQDRSLARLCLRNRMLTSTQLKREWEDDCGVVCSSRTVRKRLDDVGLCGRVARKKPLLTERHKRIRLEWAKDKINWTMAEWNKILWSDESKFNLFGSDGRVYVRRRMGEEYLPECVQPTVKFGGGNVMMWGCISCDGVGPLVKVEGRMNGNDYIKLLSASLLPFMRSMGPQYIFMDDNAPCHRAKSVINWMSSKKLQRMEVWPPQSPDLNPIEHVWKMLGARLEDYKPKNLKELEIRLNDEWLKIPAVDVQKLISSMPNRVQAVIEAKGGHTKY